MSFALFFVLCAQADELAKLQERAQKLEKIPTAAALAAEVKDIAGRLAAYLAQHPDNIPAHELLATVHQDLARRYADEKQLRPADECFVRSIQAAKTLVDKAKALPSTEANDQRRLIAGYQYIVGVYHRANALRLDPKRRDALERQVEDIEVFFKDYFDAHDVYLLAVDAATYVGSCLQFVAESKADSFAAADRLWAQCFKWVAKGRDLLSLRELREQDDAHEIAARSALREVQARIAYSRQLKSAGGPWERQLARAQNVGAGILAQVPSLRRHALGQKLQAELDAVQKMLQD